MTAWGVGACLLGALNAAVAASSGEVAGAVILLTLAALAAWKEAQR